MTQDANANPGGTPADAAATAAALAAAAAATGAAKPADKPADEKKPEEKAPELKIELKKPEEKEEVVKVDYEPTGDDGLDLALAFVGELGIGPEHKAMQAASNGDFGPIREALKALGDKAKNFEKYIALGERAFKEGKEKHDQHEKVSADRMLAAAGGKDNWVLIQAWAAKNATEAEAKEVNEALKKGGATGVAMVERLARLYRGAVGAGDYKAPKKVTKDSPANDVLKGTEALSPREYSAAVSALNASFKGKPIDGSPEYKRLQERRAAYRPGK